MGKAWEISKIDAKKSNGEIPKILIWFFLAAQLFGIDLGFTMVLKKKFQCVAQYLTFFMAVTFVIILGAPVFNLYGEIWFWMSFSEYLFFVLAFSVTKYNAYNFIIDMNEIYDIKVKEKRILSGIVTVYTSLIMIMQVVFCTIYCISNKDDLRDQFYTFYYYIFYCMPTLGLNFIVITKLIVIYYIFCCVRDLKQNLVNKRISLENMAKRYMDIADVYDKIRPFYDIIAFTQVVIGVPKMLLTLWYLLLCIKIKVKSNRYMHLPVFLFHVAFTTCLPCIVFEMVKSQIDAIALKLCGQIMTVKDESKVSEILNFLRYLKARNLHYKTWRIIPVDAQLLLSLFSVCTTYFIVLIQFTHLYE